MLRAHLIIIFIVILYVMFRAHLMIIIILIVILHVMFRRRYGLTILELYLPRHNRITKSLTITIYMLLTLL